MRVTFLRPALMAAAAVLAALACSSCATRGPAYDAGCTASRDHAMDGSARVRWLGPIVEKQESASSSNRFFAVRPFYSCTEDLALERSVRDYVWPIAMYKEFQHETYWRFLLAFGHDFKSEEPDSRWRFVVFPFVYAGKDAGGTNYFGVFPIGGDVHEFLGQDRIMFVMFPLYLYTKINDVETYDFPWPFVSRTTGTGVSRHRFFPFYGYSHRDNAYTKRFVLWPIWTQADYHYPDGQAGGGFILFPLYGHAKMTDSETWSVIPPFFRYAKNDEGYRALNCPWPFVQYNSGKDSYRMWLWPVWGTRSNDTIRSSFAAWPLVSWTEVERVQYTQNRFRVFPLLFLEKKTAGRGQRAEVRDQKSEGGGQERAGETNVASNAESGTQSPDPASTAEPEILGRGFKLWPLFSYRREEADMRLRFLDLWPGFDLAPIERNYAPLWTVYSHVRGSEGSEDEILWGLYRRQNDSEGRRKWSLFPLFRWENAPPDDTRGWKFLMGLAGYHREGLQKTYRLLYFINFTTGKEKTP